MSAEKLTQLSYLISHISTLLNVSTESSNASYAIGTTPGLRRSWFVCSPVVGT